MHTEQWEQCLLKRCLSYGKPDVWDIKFTTKALEILEMHLCNHMWDNLSLKHAWNKASFLKFRLFLTCCPCFLEPEVLALHIGNPTCSFIMRAPKGQWRMILHHIMLLARVEFVNSQWFQLKSYVCSTKPWGGTWNMPWCCTPPADQGCVMAFMGTTVDEPERSNCELPWDGDRSGLGFGCLACFFLIVWFILQRDVGWQSKIWISPGAWDFGSRPLKLFCFPWNRDWFGNQFHF